MKTPIKNLLLLPAIIVGLGLIPVGRLVAQPFTFGPQVRSTPSASITHNSGTGEFQYTDAANSSDDSAILPLTGTASTLITTTHDWTASLTASISATTMTATDSESPHVWMYLGFDYKNGSSTHLLTFGLHQENNTGGANDENFPDGFYGTGADFRARTNGDDDVTTPLGASQYIQGGSVLMFSGATTASPATESISAVTATLTLNYNASTKTVTGYCNGTPVGSYSLASWGASPPLTLFVGASSGQGIGVPAGTATASSFFAGRAPPGQTSYAVTTKSSPAAGGTTSGAGSYTNGQSVTVTATPGNCYDFVKWTKTGSVAALSTDAIYSFTITSGEALAANFELKTNAIMTLSNPVKGGTTSGGGIKNCGAKVTVKATAAAGYKFVNWSVDGTTASTLSSYSFTNEGAETLTANFADDSVPTLRITSPTAKEKVDTTLLAISGTAGNVLGVSDVVLTLNGMPVSATTTNHWTNWSASVIAAPGDNVISAYALSEAGNPSKTNTATFENTASGQAPMALAGLIGEVQGGGKAPFQISFGTATFEQFSADTNQGSSVGTYTYTQTGPDVATLATSAFAPPDQTGSGGAQLTFSSPTAATFTNADGTAGTLTLSPGLGWDVSSQSGWTITSEPNGIATTYGDGTFTSTDNNGPVGGYTSTQYGPMAAMMVLTNADPRGGVQTNYRLMMFTSRSNGQLFATLYDGAGDPPSIQSGAFTGAYQPGELHYRAPESLNGMSSLVTPLQKTDNPGASTLSFGEATLGKTTTSTNNPSVVASYTYTRTGTNTAILTVQTIAPPSSGSAHDNSDTLYVTFQSDTGATYINLNGDYGKMTFATLPQTGYFAPAALPNATFKTTYGGKSGSASFNYGNSLGHNPGTYTYTQFSPTVGMLINLPTSGNDAGVMEYVQLTFNSPSGGSSRGDFYNTIPGDNYIAIGTFTFVK